MRRRLFLLAGSLSALRAFQRKTTAPPPKHEPLWKWLLRVTGISATSRGLRGSLVSPRGDLWITPAVGSDRTRKRLTVEGDYHSPVFTPDDKRILTLRGSGFAWVSPEGGTTEKLAYELPGVLRIIGFENRAADPKPRVVAVTESSIGLFSPWDGSFRPFPVTSDDQETRQQLLRGEMQFGDVSFQLTSDGHQLSLQRGDQEPVVLAKSTTVVYADPALSHDGRQVVYIRATASKT